MSHSTVTGAAEQEVVVEARVADRIVVRSMSAGEFSPAGGVLGARRPADAVLAALVIG